MNKPDTVVTICMGSSCFSRGSNNNIEIIERFLRERNLLTKVEIRGCLCQGLCKNGPNIKIDDEIHQGIDSGMIYELLEHTLSEKIV